MKEQFNKLLKRDRLIYSGIGLGLFYFLMKIMIGNMIGSNTFMNILYIICFFVGLAGAIVVTAACYIYYTKKAKDKSILLLGGIAAITSIFTLFGLQAISAILKLGSGDYFSILYGYEEILSALRIYEWAMYFSWLATVYSTILLLESKGTVKIDAIRKMVEEGTSPTMQTEITAEDTNEEKVETNVENKPKKESTFNFGEMIKKHKKECKIGLIIIGIFAIGWAGFSVYKQFFSYTKVSLIESIKVDYTGISGKGYASIKANHGYDGNDTDIRRFLNSVYYEIDGKDKKNGSLQNGDTITIKAIYSEKKADELNLKIEKDNYQVKVSKLAEVYSKGSDIPAETLKKMKEDSDKKIKDDSIYSFSSYKSKAVYNSCYFISQEDDNTLVFVYKVTKTDSTLKDEYKTLFKAYYIKNPNSDYGKESFKSYWNYRTLYGDDYKNITNEEDILAGIKKSFYKELNQIEKLTMEF